MEEEFFKIAFRTDPAPLPAPLPDHSQPDASSSNNLLAFEICPALMGLIRLQYLHKVSEDYSHRAVTTMQEIFQLVGSLPSCTCSSSAYPVLGSGHPASSEESVEWYLERPGD
jgi:hypothetical protein